MSERAEVETPFAERRLLVLALGGNALSPPAAGGDDYGVEREIIAGGIRIPAAHRPR
jgi:hypothetical protein